MREKNPAKASGRLVRKTLVLLSVILSAVVGSYLVSQQNEIYRLNEEIRSLKETEQEDGASFHYRTVFTNVLSMVIERATGQKVETLLEEKIWQPLKPEQDAVIVADSVGMPYLGAGMNACARDLARFGQMIVQGGQLNDNQIISQAWIEDLVEGNDDVRRLFAASDYTTMRPGGHYHNQFWGSAQDNQTLMCLGIHGQYIHMNLANQTVIVKLSSQPESANNEMFPNAFLALDALSDQL